MTPSEETIWREKVANPDATAHEIAHKYSLSESYVAGVLGKSGDAEPERIRLLRRGAELTAGDRNKTYGPPYDNLDACAQVWSAYITAKYGAAEVFRLTAEDVAHMMQLVKMTRTFHGAYHADNYLDNAVYGAIAGECRMIEESF
jgi:hypothetical protein